MSISGIRFACTTAPRFSAKAKPANTNFVQQAWGLLFGVPSSGTSAQPPSPPPETTFMKEMRAFAAARGEVLSCDQPPSEWSKRLDPQGLQ
jgi:hypothetical protein